MADFQQLKQQIIENSIYHLTGDDYNNAHEKEGKAVLASIQSLKFPERIIRQATHFSVQMLLPIMVTYSFREIKTEPLDLKSYYHAIFDNTFYVYCLKQSEQLQKADLASYISEVNLMDNGTLSKTYQEMLRNFQTPAFKITFIEILRKTRHPILYNKPFESNSIELILRLQLPE